MRKDLQEYYEALGLTPGASPAEIKRAYRQLIQRWHPDHFKTGTFMQTTAEDMTKEINEAYEQLFKKQLYKKYSPKPDLRRAATSAPFTPASAPPPPTDSPPPARPRKPARPRAKRPASPWTPRRFPRPLSGRKPAVIFTIGIAVIALWLTWPAASPTTLPTGDPLSRIVPVPIPVSVPTAPDKPPAVVASANEPGRVVPALIANNLVKSIGEVAAAEHPKADAAMEPSPARAAATEISTPPRWAFQLPVPANASAGVRRAADFERLFKEASTLLTSFERGDTKARVLVIQGPADEVGENVMRYGSSLVYFSDGRVTGWSEGLPKLRIRALPGVDYDLLETIEIGSSRADVLRLQGRPSDSMWGIYFYGPSIVYFENNRVAGWSDENSKLRIPLLQSIRGRRPAVRRLSP